MTEDISTHGLRRMLLPIPRAAASRAASALILALPADELLTAVLSALDVRSIVALRSACRTTRSLTASAELWLDLTQRRWRRLLGHGELEPCAGVPSSIMVLPDVLGTASIVDVHSRLVRWPRTMVTISADVTVVSADGDCSVCFCPPTPPRRSLASGPYQPAAEDTSVAPSPQATPVLQQQFVIAEMPFPHMRMKHGQAAPRRPLPFASEGVALRAGHSGWALRTTVYFEVTLLAGPTRRGAVSIGLADSQPSGTVLGNDAHSFGWQLDGSHFDVASDTGLAPWLHATEPPESVLMYTEPRGGSKRSVPVEASVAAHATLGCGVDFARGCAFWTCNKRLVHETQGEGAVRLETPWYAVIGAAGSTSLQVNFGQAPFSFDLHAHECSNWHTWEAKCSEKALFEEQAARDGTCLDPDLDKRGWPWEHRGWKAVVEYWVTSWLHRERRARLLSSKPTTDVPHLQPPSSSSLEHEPPACLPLRPAADPLLIFPEDRPALSRLVDGAGLPVSVTDQLLADGLSVRMLSELPPPQLSIVLRRARVPTGARLRLKSAVEYEFGTQIDASAPRSSAEAGASPPSSLSPCQAQLARLFPLRRPCLMVVLLAPSLPVRDAPNLLAPICSTRRLGEIVVATAERAGWLEIRPSDMPPDLLGGARGAPSAQRSGGWVLWDGRRASHHVPLLSPLRCCDATALAPRQASWPLQISAVNAAGGEEASGSLQVPPERVVPEPTTAEDIRARGGDSAELTRVARRDRAELSELLKRLGYLKIGQRLQIQQQLLWAARADDMPSISSALQRSEDEREMTALLQLASLPDSLMSPLLATGVRVRQMHDSSLEQIEEAAATTCATNSELLRFLEAVHVRVKGLATGLDAAVRAEVAGEGEGTVAVVLAEADVDGYDPPVRLARAVRGGADSRNGCT